MERRMIAKCSLTRVGRPSKPLATIRFSDTVPLRFPRVGSSMVEQRPFKALVVGSSPTQPTFDFSTLTSQVNS